VIKRNPEEHLASLAQIRDAALQRAFISNTQGSSTQGLIESISTKIRELLPRDPDLAQILAETNLYVASLVDTPVAWAYANRSRAQVLYTRRKSAEAEAFFDRAAQLFEKAGLNGEFGRTLVGQMDNLRYLSRYSEALKLAEKANRRMTRCTCRRWKLPSGTFITASIDTTIPSLTTTALKKRSRIPTII
jgi:tetratricopeptide (TPR) repeat protein